MHKKLPSIQRAQCSRYRISQSDHTEQFVLSRINHGNCIRSLVSSVNTIVIRDWSIRTRPGRLLCQRAWEQAKKQKVTDRVHISCPFECLHWACRSLSTAQTRALLAIVPLTEFLIADQ